jgi:hypothetical protein
VNKLRIKPDWLFRKRRYPRKCRRLAPFFLDYLFLGYNTATAFSPTDLAAYPSRQDVDDARKHDLALDDRPRRGRAVNVLP